MTSPTIAIPATSSDLTAAVKALTAADPGYQKAGAYYAGKIAEVFASVRLRRAMTRTGMSFVFNFARMPVDALAERVSLSAVTATPAAANDALAAVWKRNKMRLTGKQIHRNAFKYGDAYVIVWPDPDDESQVDIFYNSPRSVRVFYDPENPRKKAFAIKRWQQPDKTTRVDLFYPDRIEKYLMVGKGQQAKWVQWTDKPGDEWPYDNPFGEIPVFHFKTDEPYGCPEHEGFYGPQDAIHKLIISHMAGVDYQAFPQRYALREADSDTSEAADADEDEFAFASGTGSTEPSAEGRAQLKADPGSLWDLKGYKSVGQFATADPTIFTEPMLVYLRFGAQVTNTPLFRVDPTGSIPSGESRKVAEAPFVAKAEDRQLAFQDTWEELTTFALKVAGTPAASVDVQWTPLQSADDMGSWQMLQAKLQAGLPAQQAFLEAGYSSEQIKEWFGDEDGDLAQSVDILVKIGQALASLGTAVNLGALTNEQLQLLIAAIIGDPDHDGVADIIDPRDIAHPEAEDGESGMAEADPGEAA
jgi:hypothetical protein